MDGSESVSVGARLHREYRLLPQPGSPVASQLADLEDEISTGTLSEQEGQRQFRQAILSHARRLIADWPILLCGQDVALAAPLAEKYVTVAGILQGIAAAATRHTQQAAEQAALAEQGPMAKSHGTRFPILQGPMTRVSDVAAFADAVSAQGGLPFLALALLREQQVAELLIECRQRLGDRPWGVGLLGFLPPEIRQEQVRAIKHCPPAFAIIAGGRPDQALELEQEGITTYLHVPSPGLLRMFLRQGARRFIFEGRECGGHVGPRSSFVLWEQQIEVVLQHVAASGGALEFHVVFAGGIHDARSAAMVAAMAAPLVARGVKIGILMGTAYLFTREAVETGAIVPRFQQEALQADGTVLFETGPGHAIRCIKSPYFDDFHAEKIRLKNAGKPHREIVIELERKNTGRLRMASKGVDRRVVKAGAPREVVNISHEEQFQQGMYMVGQVAALHQGVIDMRRLHQAVSSDAVRLLKQAAGSQPRQLTPTPNRCDVAIIGMACFYPAAKNLTEYWDNILNRVYAVTEIPETHWDWRIFYDENPRAHDKIVSKWGGFLGDIAFDPLKYGITPASLKSIEPLQLLLLECVSQALQDAGYEKRPFDRENTCAILGIGGGGSPMGISYGFRTCLPMLETVEEVTVDPRAIVAACEPLLPAWTEDSFPGILMNVAVGRVANRFDLGGTNYALDAACASSLAAVHACCRELELGTANVALAMGADTVQTPYAYMAFSKTHALSPQGRCRPFDAGADGIVLSEGLGVVVLKRLEDAERDGDKVYAVIRGVGSSSDGKDKGLTAPNSAGQLRALRRAYQKADLPPSRVGLIEAHGTGTVVGDRTELQALATVMAESQADPQSCALGSVKSMIGHSKCAAGVAGLIKATMALHHKILPPTLVENPNTTANLVASALYLNTTSRPWIEDRAQPRCAGVSAFGFGGTNVHVVLEEYQDGIVADQTAALAQPPAELILLRRESVAELLRAIDQLSTVLARSPKIPLRELAAVAWRQSSATKGRTLAIVAESCAHLQELLEPARAMCERDQAPAHDPRGIYYSGVAQSPPGKVAMVFPGQGSQYPNMLAEVACCFAPVRNALESFTRQLHSDFDRPLTRFIYPPSAFSEEERESQRLALANTDVAQPAIGAASMGMFRLLTEFNVCPDVVAGHSYGEFTALWAAGVIEDGDLIRISQRRGNAMREAAGDGTGGMVAVTADESAVRACLGDLSGITLANLNAPDQTVISGRLDALQAALDRFQSAGLKGQALSVSCAFHSPEMSAAETTFAEVLKNTPFAAPQLTVFSNQTAQPHPADSAAIRRQLALQITSPVRFRDEVEAMYDAGVRTFIEVGPQNQLTGLIKRTLGQRAHVAVATDVASRSGLTQLVHCLGQLLTVNVDVMLDPWFKGRVSHAASYDELEKRYAETYSPTTWIVNGIRNRPWQAAEPRLLGKRSPTDSPTSATFPRGTPMPTNGSSKQPQNLRSNMTHPANSPLSSSPAAATEPVEAAPPEVVQPVPTQGFAMPQAATGEPSSSQPAEFTQPLPAGVDPVMIGFQELMSQFLETQRDVMLAYLQGPGVTLGSDGTGTALPTHSGSRSLPQIPEVRASQVTHASSPGQNGDGQMDAGGLVANPHPSATPLPAVDRGNQRAATDGSQPQSAATRPAAAPSAGATAAEPATSSETMESITDRLIEIVSQRTGYPREMLNLDLDLEADLGIDSIKRVEILGELAESLNLSQDDDGALELEKLTVERTLRGMLNYLEGALFGEESAPAAARRDSSKTSKQSLSTSGNGSVSKDGDRSQQPQLDSPSRITASTPARQTEATDDAVDTTVIQRAKIRLVEIPLPATGATVIPSGTVIVTDDELGLGVEIADRLADFGQSVTLIRHVESKNYRHEGGMIHADLTDPQAVQHAVELVRRSGGRIAGLIHALPLAAPTEEPRVDQRAAWVGTQSLYLLAQNIHDDLKQSAQSGNAFVLAVLGMGGRLGYDRSADRSSVAAGGGVIGFVKCLALELPDVMVRVVDVDPRRAMGDNVDVLMSELGDADGPVEVGNNGHCRITWEPVPAELDLNGKPTVQLDASSVILLTGGARGITAKIAEELGRRFRPHLILVGRSAWEPAESAETRDVPNSELKQALIGLQTARGQQPDPRLIEQTYQQRIKDRELRDNLQAIRDTGAQVDYRAVDMRDAQAVQQLVQSILDKYGRLDGVIHGAGVIEDKLIADKTMPSFERVFGTKVDSAIHLSRLLPEETLQFVALFASIASRFGNRGQADYAAANEFLSKLAVEWDRRTAARVFSVAWGPWSQVGMVAGLAPYLEARGLSLIPPEVGAKMFVDELVFGGKGESEIIIAGGAENLVATAVSPSRTE